jgi:hypothetical protein
MMPGGGSFGKLHLQQDDVNIVMLLRLSFGTKLLESAALHAGVSFRRRPILVALTSATGW